MLALGDGLCHGWFVAEAGGSWVDGRKRALIYHGESIGSREIAAMREIIRRHRGSSRGDLARRVCQRFGWRRPNGEYSVESCYGLLVRLEGRGLITLPASRNGGRKRTLPASPTLPEAELRARAGEIELGAPLLVRPIIGSERQLWQSYLAHYHYLGFRPLVGESLRYFALLGDAVVGIVAWSVAARYGRARDGYIGWDDARRRLRRAYVVNNVRFLVLPWAQRKNLASQILGANLRRLSRDWEAAHGHRVLLAETFVDRSRFVGTCYRASNWTCVGETRGYARQGGGYVWHGQKKAVFVFPLHRNACRWLREGKSPIDPAREEAAMVLELEKLPLSGAGGLFDALGKVADPRMRRGIRHPMLSVLAMAACATLAGARSLAAIAQWAAELSHEQRKLLGARHRYAPNESTFRRVLAKTDVTALDQVTGQWLARHGISPGEGIAIDGKTLRGSHDGEKRPVHLVSAVLHREGIVVAQTPVAEKSNEITSVEPLFADLDIKGAVVTGDAMFTQRAIARHLVGDKQADYVLQVKDNQPTLRQSVEDRMRPLVALPPSARDQR